MYSINFFSQDVRFSLKQRTILKAYINQLFLKENKKLSALTCIFCSDNFLLQINQQFLNHDFYTDIVTFDLSDTQNSITAELYISVDRVRENAKMHSVSFREELHRVIFHGALHLCGYKDKKKEQILIMRSKEELYLRGYL